MLAKNKTSFFQKFRKYLRNIIFGVNIVFILLMLCLYLAWYVKPSDTTLFSYIGLSLLPIVIINILFLVFWLILTKWKLALVQLIAIVLCWIPIKTYVPIHFKSSEIPQNSIKILSYNVKAFGWITGKKAVDNPMIKYIAESGADIICMQEFMVNDIGKGDLITDKQFNALLKDYPYHSLEKSGGVGSYTYGIACYSKYPILKVTRLPLQSTYNGSVMYQIKIKDKTVTLFNNHLESNRITSADVNLYRQFFKDKNAKKFDQVAINIKSRLGIAYKKRQIQANIIKSYMDKDTSDAIIVCGDFNDTPVSYTYNTVKGDLIDSYASTGFGHGMTYHENKFWFRIDYIMHSNTIESYNCTVDDTIKDSDHYPISTYLKFKD